MVVKKSKPVQKKLRSQNLNIKPAGTVLIHKYIYTYQVIQSDHCISQLEVTNNLKKGHLTSPKKVTKNHLVYSSTIWVFSNSGLNEGFLGSA